MSGKTHEYCALCIYIMFNIVLVHPEIPPNTGNIIRLAANTGCALHLIEPLGFPLDHAKMRRAGLDYHEFAHLNVHRDWQTFLHHARPETTRMFALTTKGSAPFAQAQFKAQDWLVFGSETAGLPNAVRESFPTAQRIRLPMRAGQRSLNLSNAVAVVVYEAWRQCGFAQGS
jgi:tRNA (cytidine/uridine-2'-O-)-methyltransferase